MAFHVFVSDEAALIAYGGTEPVTGGLDARLQVGALLGGQGHTFGAGGLVDARGDYLKLDALGRVVFFEVRNDEVDPDAPDGRRGRDHEFVRLAGDPVGGAGGDVIREGTGRLREVGDHGGQFLDARDGSARGVDDKEHLFYRRVFGGFVQPAGDDVHIRSAHKALDGRKPLPDWAGDWDGRDVPDHVRLRGFAEELRDHVAEAGGLRGFDVFLRADWVNQKRLEAAEGR